MGKLSKQNDNGESFRIGGSLKTTIRELMSFHTSTPINSLLDLMNLLKGNTRNNVTMFSKSDISREKASLPASLKSLKGALQIHELQVSREGHITAKKLPTDNNYMRVNLDPTFARGLANTVPAERLQTPQIEIHAAIEMLQVHDVETHPRVVEE